MIAFFIWGVCGILFVGIGIYDYFAKIRRPFGFWANAKQFEVNDVKAYNKALGKLFIGFGVAFILIGLPLLDGQNSPWIILSIIGAMVWAIVLMVIYTMVIEPKYRKK